MKCFLRSGSAVPLLFGLLVFGLHGVAHGSPARISHLRGIDVSEANQANFLRSLSSEKKIILLVLCIPFNKKGSRRYRSLRCFSSTIHLDSVSKTRKEPSHSVGLEPKIFSSIRSRQKDSGASPSFPAKHQEAV